MENNEPLIFMFVGALLLAKFVIISVWLYKSITKAIDNYITRKIQKLNQPEIDKLHERIMSADEIIDSFRDARTRLIIQENKQNS